MRVHYANQTTHKMAYRRFFSAKHITGLTGVPLETAIATAVTAAQTAATLVSKTLDEPQVHYQVQDPADTMAYSVLLMFYTVAA